MGAALQAGSGRFRNGSFGHQAAKQPPLEQWAGSAAINGASVEQRDRSCILLVSETMTSREMPVPECSSSVATWPDSTSIHIRSHIWSRNRWERKRANASVSLSDTWQWELPRVLEDERAASRW